MDCDYYHAKVIYVHAGVLFDVVLTLPGCITVKLRIYLNGVDSRDFSSAQKKRMKEIALALLLGRQVVVHLEGERSEDVYPGSILFENQSLEEEYGKDGRGLIDFGSFLTKLAKKDTSLKVSANVLMG